MYVNLSKKILSKSKYLATLMYTYSMYQDQFWLKTEYLPCLKPLI